MKTYISIILALLALHLFILSRIGFTYWPEMLSYPYLLNNGFTLYKDYIHPYPPILTVTLSYLFKFFGYNQWVVKIFTWVLILASDLGILLLARKLTGSLKLGVLSLIIFIVSQPFFEGNMLWFDLAIVPSVLFGVFFLIDKKYLLSGTLFAVAALTKQTTGVFFIIAVITMFFDKTKAREYINFLAGPFILGSLFVVKLLIEGTFIDAFNWMFFYPFTFWTDFPGYVNFKLSGGDVLNLLVVFIFPILYLITNLKSVLSARSSGILSAFYIVSFLIVYPRFSFFHLQLAIALNAVLFAAIVRNNGLNLFRYRFLVTKPFIAIWVFAIFILGVIYSQQADRFNGMNRFWSDGDIEVAKMIKSATGEGNIFLLGLPSSMYVFNNMLPPKPWADNFGWYYEVPEFQEKVIQSWEQSPPKYIFVSKSNGGAWYDLGVYKPKKIVEWIESNYEPVGPSDRGFPIWKIKEL